MLSNPQQFARRPLRRHRLQLLVTVLAPLAYATTALASAGRKPAGSFAAFKDCPTPSHLHRSEVDDDGDDQSPSWLAITTDEKLQRLIEADVTSAEIALVTGSSLRAVEERRRSLRAG